MGSTMLTEEQNSRFMSLVFDKYADKAIDKDTRKKQLRYMCRLKILLTLNDVVKVFSIHQDELRFWKKRQWQQHTHV